MGVLPELFISISFYTICYHIKSSANNKNPQKGKEKMKIDDDEINQYLFFHLVI